MSRLGHKATEGEYTFVTVERVHCRRPFARTVRVPSCIALERARELKEKHRANLVTLESGPYRIRFDAALLLMQTRERLAARKE